MDMHPSPDYFGMLYEERGRGIVAQRGQQVLLDAKGTKHVVGKIDKTDKLDITQWNEYRITARGNRLEHYVNGKLTARIIDNDPKKRSMKGVLALQLHAGAPMRVEIKDIRLRDRTPATKKKAPTSTGVKKTETKSLAKLKRPPTAEWI